MNASAFLGFSVLLGPPLTGDCDLVYQWIILGLPNRNQLAQLYQISYYCHIFGVTSDFVRDLTDSNQITAEPPIAAVSVVVQRQTVIQSILVYLITKGWQRVGLFYEIGLSEIGSPDILGSINLALPVSNTNQQIINMVYNGGIREGMNFTSLLLPIQDQLDVALIMSRPSVAAEFLMEVQNLNKIKEGRIALIQVNTMDMLTYDALRDWKHVLTAASPTLDAGLSLIILTALPTGTNYDENSTLYKEVISFVFK